MSSSFLAAKITVCPADRARRPPWGWLAGKKSSSLRCGIFSRQALRGPGSNANICDKK